MSRYGVPNSQQSPEIREKVKQTCLKRYGVENYTQTSEYWSRVRSTNLERYGVPFHQQKEIQHFEAWNDKNKMIKVLNSFNEKPAIGDLVDYFNLRDWSVVYDKIHDWGLEELVRWNPSRSHYEDEIIDFLHSLNITNLSLNNKDLLDGKEIDIYALEYKIGIEFNGDYWHSDIYFNDHNGRSTQHQEKSLLAEKKEFFCFTYLSTNGTILPSKRILRTD